MQKEESRDMVASTWPKYIHTAVDYVRNIKIIHDQACPHVNSDMLGKRPNGFICTGPCGKRCLELESLPSHLGVLDNGTAGRR